MTQKTFEVQHGSQKKGEPITTIQSVFFAETFWSLNHFSQLSHSCINTCRNSVFQVIFSDILTEMT